MESIENRLISLRETIMEKIREKDIIILRLQVDLEEKQKRLERLEKLCAEREARIRVLEEEEEEEEEEKSVESVAAEIVVNRESRYWLW